MPVKPAESLPENTEPGKKAASREGPDCHKKAVARLMGMGHDVYGDDRAYSSDYLG